MKRNQLLKVGREYEYLGMPVKVIRVDGKNGEECVIETRFGERSTINSSELGDPWSTHARS